MDFVVTAINPKKKEIRVEYGPISLTCRVLETNGLPFIQKPPYVFIQPEAWPSFVRLVRKSWYERRNDDNEKLN